MKAKRKLGLECPKCKDRIFSFYRHHFNHCKCTAIYIDGGDDYMRCGWDPTEVDGNTIKRRVFSIKKDGKKYKEFKSRF